MTRDADLGAPRIGRTELTESREKQVFGVDPSIIRRLIERQAGSVEKAILEAVMNSIDAKATRIDIDFKGLKKFVVADNGPGFPSREAIMKRFGVFGFDHDEAEEKAVGRTFGKFGLGRGQLMAFARTQWDTNEFEIRVDTREKGLGFALREHDAPIYSGCRIAASLYEALSPGQKNVAVDELKRQTRYAPIEVYVDGVRLNKDADRKDWTKSTEAFRFFENEGAGGINVYNLGIFVATYPHWRHGVSGDLVSRPGHGFELNIARNDVLKGQCKLWKQAIRLLTQASETRHATQRLCDADRQAVIHKVLAGNDDAASRRDAKLFKLASGRHVPITSVRNHAGGEFTIAPASQSQIGETIHRERGAAVLSPEMLAWFGVDDGKALAKRLNKLWPQQSNYWCKEFTYLSFDKLAEPYRGDCKVLPGKAQTPMEVAAVRGIRRMADTMVYRLQASEEYKQRCDGEARNRKIVLGSSPRAWGVDRWRVLCGL